MKWTGIITKISEVDAGGNTLVIFDILGDKSDIVYTNMQTSGKPDNILLNMTTIIANLQTSVLKSKDLFVGLEVVVDDKKG